MIMDRTERQRCIYISTRQKKKLIELMAKHPELILCKVTDDFKYKDSQKIWQNIANECNTIPGAKKTWRQWRKTWHDLRFNTKKRQAESNNDVARSAITLTEAEQEVLGIKPVTDITPLEELQQESLNSNVPETSSESESIPEEKITISSMEINLPQHKKNSKVSCENFVSCNLNCDVIVAQERRKFDLKVDYISFKKDYLKQKLKLLKEQNEALKNIAKELSKMK